jgi:hypothetical protein
MNASIVIETLVVTSETTFSVDELVYRVRQLFEKEGLAGFVALELALVDEHLSLGLTGGRTPTWLPKPCCDRPHYEALDRRPRQIRTSVGVVKMQLRRVRCTVCGARRVPLREFLGLEPWQSRTAELERIVTEVVSDQSYRRTTRHLSLIGEIPVPKSTAHRWVAECDCDRLEPPPEEKLDALVADSTGYKRRPTKDQDNQGDLRVALGVKADGRVVPLGAWSGTDWETIAEQLNGPYGQKGPMAHLLVSDGDRHLAGYLANLADREQRCQWHAVRDLGAALWRQKMPKEERTQWQDRLAGLVGIDLPAEALERVAPEDREALARSVARAELEIARMVDDLSQRGYTHAAYYVDHARQRLFNYVRLWLECGLVSPRVTSIIERLMREIGRRLKRIAFGWSPAGAAKMARIIIKRIVDPAQWDRYWRRRLRIEGNVHLLLRSLRVG